MPGIRAARLRALAGLVAVGLLIAASVPMPGAKRPGGAPVWIPVTERTLSHGRFDQVTVYAPHDPPRGFVLLLSGASGWTPRLAALARQLAGSGAMVAGIDTAQLAAKFDADPAACVFPDGDLENLSHFIQAYARLPTYLTPILAGDAAGAALAYASLAQAPANTFGGGVGLQFCPRLELRKPLCRSGALEFRPDTGGTHGAGALLEPAAQLGVPWLVLEPPAPVPDNPACTAGATARFVAQLPGAALMPVSAPPPAAGDAVPWPQPYLAPFATLVERNAPAPGSSAPPALADLPIVFVAAQPGVAPSDTFAIMLSGDGGWAGLDKDVAAALAADGISVVGLDSLRYFWSARTPEGIAADLERMIRHYRDALGKQRVLLIGYSQGADVLPFAVNRLSAATRAQVALTAIMGMSEHALFEFHMSSWLADDESGPATLPEVDRISGMPVLCIYGEDESDSLCPQLDARRVLIVKLKGGHHFDGNYAGLARTILAAARH